MSNFTGDRANAADQLSSLKRANDRNPITWDQDIETGLTVNSENDQGTLNANLHATKQTELSSLPTDLSDYEIGDIINVAGETHIVRAAPGNNQFAGQNAGAHDHLSATTNSHAGALPIYGQFTSDPDNAIAGVVAHTIGLLQILIKKSSYETAKGSAVANSDKITAVISAGSPSKTDTITLSRKPSNDYTDDGVDYLVFEYADNDGDLNYWRIDDGTAWTMRLFKGSNTNTPLLVHDSGAKHLVLYHYDDETRLDQEIAANREALEQPSHIRVVDHVGGLTDFARPTEGWRWSLSNHWDGGSQNPNRLRLAIVSDGTAGSLPSAEEVDAFWNQYFSGGQSRIRRASDTTGDGFSVTSGEPVRTNQDGTAGGSSTFFWQFDLVIGGAGFVINQANVASNALPVEFAYPQAQFSNDNTEILEFDGAILSKEGNLTKVVFPGASPTPFRNAFFGTDDDGNVVAMRLHETRVDDERVETTAGYHYTWPDHWHIRHDIDPHGTRDASRQIRPGDQVDLISYSNDAPPGYDHDRPGFTWDNGPKALRFNGIDWSIQTAGTTTRKIHLTIRVQVDATQGDSWSMILTSSDNKLLGVNAQTTRRTVTAPATQIWDWTEEWVLEPNGLSANGTTLKIQIRLNSSGQGVGFQYVYDSDVSVALPDVDHVPIQGVALAKPSTANIGGSKAVVKASRGSNADFLSRNYLSFANGAFSFSQDLRNALIIMYANADATRLGWGLQLWTWLDGLFKPHLSRWVFDNQQVKRWYRAVDIGPIKAGQKFMLVLTGDNKPTTLAQMGNPAMTINTNVDLRFAKSSILIPGLIRNTVVYEELLLAGRNVTELTLDKKPLEVAHKDALIALYAVIRAPNGNAKLAGSIMLHAARALADTNNYALAGHWGSGQDETMRWDPDDNKIVLTGGPVAAAINDTIEVWVEHYL